MESWSRRSFVIASFASVSSPVWAQSNVNSDSTTEIEQEITKEQRHNLSSFRALDWRPYFSNLKNGAILVDTTSRAYIFGLRMKLYTIFTHLAFQCQTS